MVSEFVEFALKAVATKIMLRDNAPGGPGRCCVRFTMLEDGNAVILPAFACKKHNRCFACCSADSTCEEEFEGAFNAGDKSCDPLCRCPSAITGLDLTDFSVEKTTRTN